MEQIRSFIAIELPEELKLALARLQEQVKSGKPTPVKWVDPYNIHLTLKFLGNIGTDMVDTITKALEKAVNEIAAFHLETQGLGAFPGLKRIQVLWVGLTGEVERLHRLQQAVESSLVPLGFPPESRPFTAHLTLARIRDRINTDEQQRLGQLIAGTDFAYDSLDVDFIYLMKSQLTKQGPIYSKLSSIALKKHQPLSTDAI